MDLRVVKIKENDACKSLSKVPRTESAQQMLAIIILINHKLQNTC